MPQFYDGRRGQEYELPQGDGSWHRRDISQILGFVWHHTAGGDNPEATARYHAGANHTSSDGMPGLAYAFYVRRNGDVWQGADLADVTWSQGGGTVPDADGDGKITRDGDGAGNANARYLAIVFGGSFVGPHNKGGEVPTAAALVSGLQLVQHLTGEAEVPWLPGRLFGGLPHLSTRQIHPHASFGKAACPGALLEAVALGLQAPREAPSVLEWQVALQTAGHDPGPLDGLWGPQTKAALRAYQGAEGLPVTGHRDTITETNLFGGAR